MVAKTKILLRIATLNAHPTIQKVIKTRAWAKTHNDKPRENQAFNQFPLLTRRSEDWEYNSEAGQPPKSLKQGNSGFVTDGIPWASHPHCASHLFGPIARTANLLVFASWMCSGRYAALLDCRELQHACQDGVVPCAHGFSWDERTRLSISKAYMAYL